MAQRTRKEIEEEISNLKEIMKFYVTTPEKIRAMNKFQIEQHIDSILDRIYELKQQLSNEEYGDHS